MGTARSRPPGSLISLLLIVAFQPHVLIESNVQKCALCLVVSKSQISRVFALTTITRDAGHYMKTRHAIFQCRYFVVQVSAIALFDYVMYCLLGWELFASFQLSLEFIDIVLGRRVPFFWCWLELFGTRGNHS